MERDKALRFVAAQPNSGAYNVSPMDSDLYSWVIMNGDLFPSSAVEEPLLFDSSTSPYRGLVEEEYLESHSFKPDVSIKSEIGGSSSSSENDVSKRSNSETSNLSPDAKRRRRLEKNREIARNCRKRKREKFNQLEEEVIKLRQYSRQLEMKLNQGKNGKEHKDVRLNEVRAIEKLMQQQGTDDVLREKLLTYKDMYSDFGRERKNAIRYHMEQLKSLLLPTQVSKMTLWSLQQDDDFYDEKTNQKTFGGGIWNMLSSVLQFTDEQKRGLIDMRHQIRHQRKNIAECLRILNELDTRVTKNFEQLATQMETIMTLTTPRQQAQFLLWIEKNQACMHMLNNIWKEDLNLKPESSSKEETTELTETPTSNKLEDDDEEHQEVQVRPEDMEAILKRAALAGK